MDNLTEPSIFDAEWLKQKAEFTRKDVEQLRQFTEKHIYPEKDLREMFTKLDAEVTMLKYSIIHNILEQYKKNESKR